MDYGEVLSKAWKIAWKFKVLWIFGILASCGQSQGGNFNFNNSFRTNGNGFPNSTPNLPPAMMDQFYRFTHLFDDPTFIWKFVAVVIAAVCVIVLVEIFLGTMGRIGLIKGSAEADAGAELNVDNSVINDNGTGIVSGGIVRLSNTDVSFNATGISGTVSSYGNNRFSGNGSDGTTPTPIGSTSNPSGQK